MQSCPNSWYGKGKHITLYLTASHADKQMWYLFILEEIWDKCLKFYPKNMFSPTPNSASYLLMNE